MKVAILNVKYSPNLGDGVIAECIEGQLPRFIDGLEIFSIDIGGMDDYGSGGSILGAKLGLMGYVRKLPDILQNPIKQILMPVAVARKYGSVWKEKLSGCDAIIIGGGQLFMDVDQYFPMRILSATRQAKKGISVAVYAVGVSRKLTARGTEMFKNIFRHGRLVHASVRDPQARDNWIKHFGAEIAPAVSRDPGFLASETYGTPAFQIRPDRARKVIAFGVSDPASMSPHSDSDEGVVCGAIDFYLQTLPLLTPQYDIRMFTNGEDYVYLGKVAEAIKTLPADVQSRITVLPRALKPVELVNQIADADILIAHRLHANIVSYSHGIPHIGLGWDSKLKSFFQSIGRPDFIITSNRDASANVAALVVRCDAEGIDREMHARVIAETKDGLRKLADAIKQG